MIRATGQGFPSMPVFGQMQMTPFPGLYDKNSFKVAPVGSVSMQSMNGLNVTVVNNKDVYVNGTPFTASKINDVGRRFGVQLAFDAQNNFSVKKENSVSSSRVNQK